MHIWRKLIEEKTVGEEAIEEKTADTETISGKFNPYVEAAAPLYLGRINDGRLFFRTSERRYFAHLADSGVRQ